MAPYQVVIVPIPPRKGDGTRPCCPRRARSRPRCARAGVRVHLDDRDTQQPGFKYADWEMRGVPLRLELGPKDIEKDQCVLVRRDTREKAFVPLAGLAAAVRETAGRACRRDLLERARQVRGRQHHARRELRRVQAGDGRASAASSWPAGAATRPARRRSRRRRRPPCA